MPPYKVGYFVGSLAKASINRNLARALVRLAPQELELAEISFKDLPLYSYDYDVDFPLAARALKQALASVDAVLFVTPEYNRSIPGALKNAVDWASRPHGKNSFARQPSAVIGTSPGAIGTAIAQQQLRTVLSACNSPQMNAPEAYIRFTPGLITDDGEVTNESTAAFLRHYMGGASRFHCEGMHGPAVWLPVPSGVTDTTRTQTQALTSCAVAPCCTLSRFATERYADRLRHKGVDDRYLDHPAVHTPTAPTPYTRVTSP